MQVPDESDYAENPGKKVRGFNALGRKLGIIRLSALHLMFGILALTADQLMRFAAS